MVRAEINETGNKHIIAAQQNQNLALQETKDTLQDEGHTQTESEEMEKKIFHANENDKKVGVAILVSDKINFKTKAIKKAKGRHYIMIKGSTQEEDITLINIYTANIGAPKYIKQILTDIKGERDGNTIVVGDFNTPLTSMDRYSRLKISKTTEILNDTTEQLDLIDIFKTLCPKYIHITHSFQAHMEHSLSQTHTRTQNKPQHILDDRNYFKHLF